MRTTKGVFKKMCYRASCDNDNATYFNYATRKYYCRTCAELINKYNRSDAIRIFGSDLCVEHDKPIL